MENGNIVERLASHPCFISLSACILSISCEKP